MLLEECGEHVDDLAHRGLVVNVRRLDLPPVLVSEQVRYVLPQLDEWGAIVRGIGKHDVPLGDPGVVHAVRLDDGVVAVLVPELEPGDLVRVSEHER